jgi:hypothetical protein
VRRGFATVAALRPSSQSTAKYAENNPPYRSTAPVCSVGLHLRQPQIRAARRQADYSLRIASTLHLSSFTATYHTVLPKIKVPVFTARPVFRRQIFLPLRKNGELAPGLPCPAACRSRRYDRGGVFRRKKYAIP